MSRKEQSSATGQSSERGLLQRLNEEEGAKAGEVREQRLKWCQEKEEKMKEPL